MLENVKEKPRGAGKSSFELIDPEKLFRELPLKKGSVFLDMGCGKGDYVLAASEIIGDQGIIYAIDLWEEAIISLREQASKRRINNIRAIVGDISRRLPIEDRSVDICFLATVLHDLVEDKVASSTLKEVTRILTPRGTLAIVEFKKIEGPPGPPAHIRLTHEDVEGVVIPCGFSKEKFLEIGPFNYLITFAKGS